MSPFSANPAPLRRVRWAVRATLTFAVGASVAANILHADRNPISEAIAGWPPLALLLTVELVSRVPMHRRLLAGIRILATAVISGIAAYVSYWHMVGVASRYGETDASPYLLPVSVDGLIVVASISLVELAGRIRTAETPPTTQPTPTPEQAAPAVSTVVAPVTVPEVVEPVVRLDAPAPAPERVQAAAGHSVVQAPDDPAPSAELLARARSVAAAHLRTTRTGITPDELARYLRVSPQVAGVLHALVLNDPGHLGNGHTPAIGELTR